MAYKLEANKPYYIKVSGYNGGTQNYDPYLKLYTDESLTDRIGFHNTIVAAELTAGKTYYLQFSGYLMKYARGRITVKKG